MQELETWRNCAIKQVMWWRVRKQCDFLNESLSKSSSNIQTIKTQVSSPKSLHSTLRQCRMSNAKPLQVTLGAINHFKYFTQQEMKNSSSLTKVWKINQNSQ